MIKTKPKFVGEWQYDQKCVHGQVMPYRWVGSSWDESEPEFGKSDCKECAEEYRKTVVSGYEYEGRYGLA